MDFFQVGFKTFIYWLTVGALLFLCLFLDLKPTNKIENQTILLSSKLEVPSNKMYFADNKFQIDLSGTKQVQININLKDIDLDSVDSLVIEKLNQPTHIQTTLHWTQDKILNQAVLSNHSPSITQFISNQRGSDNFPSIIENMFLSIEANPEIGTKATTTEPYNFSQIYLDNQQNIVSDISILHWFNFNPIRFASINSNITTHTSVYNSLIFKIGAWILLSSLCFIIIKPATFHWIMTFFIAWSLTAIPYIANHFTQHQQIINSIEPASTFINHTDREAYDLANKIKPILRKLNINDTEHKLIIVGHKNFFRLRLHEYMLPVNSALIGLQYIDPINFKPNQYHLFTGDSMYVCQAEPNYTDAFNAVNIIYSNDLFCIYNKHD